MRYDINEFDITITNGRWCVDYYDVADDSWTTILMSIKPSQQDRTGYRYLTELVRTLCNYQAS